MAEAGQSHLSIGEVLGLLLEEFPDVTISKIRFLESQGLIEPERTPSGYRKFFDDDVVLLRLILREQREKFLPLRVIKDRIDSGEIEPPPDAPSAADDGREKPTKAAIAKHPAARRPSSASVPSSGATILGAEEPAAGAGRPRRRRRRPKRLRRRARPRTGRRRSRGPTEADQSDQSDQPSAPRKRRRAAEPSAATLLPGVLVNREELCAMASVTPEQLAQLEDYGVVSPRGRGRRPLRGRGGRDRRGRRGLLARRCRCPPPAGVADVRRTRIRPVRAADPAPVAAAQPSGARSGRRPPGGARRARDQAAGGADAGRPAPVPGGLSALEPG